MIRLLPFALLLAGCPLPDEDKADETGDTAGDTGDDPPEEGEITIVSMDGTCSETMCTWEIRTDLPMGGVSLTLIETGDPSYSCFLECGVWTETHSNFTAVDGTGTVKTITLALVDNFEYQVEDMSTLFDVSQPSIAEQLTVLFVAEDADGSYGDCATYGHMPEHFADVCTNNANEW